MTDEKEEEVVDSAKLSKQDRKELQEGACVNCAILTIIITFLSMLAFVL